MLKKTSYSHLYRICIHFDYIVITVSKEKSIHNYILYNWLKMGHPGNCLDEPVGIQSDGFEIDTCHHCYHFSFFLFRYQHLQSFNIYKFPLICYYFNDLMSISFSLTSINPSLSLTKPFFEHQSYKTMHVEYHIDYLRFFIVYLYKEIKIWSKKYKEIKHVVFDIKRFFSHNFFPVKYVYSWFFFLIEVYSCYQLWLLTKKHTDVDRITLNTYLLLYTLLPFYNVRCFIRFLMF